MTWIKTIENGDYRIGIGLFIDNRIKSKPEFRFNLYVDPEDTRDIRAYSHAGWPPKEVMKSLGISVTVFTKLASGGYDAWIPFPNVKTLDGNVLQSYAKHLLDDLDRRIEKGKRWTKKTHRWEYQ